jgi:hypothetical protein
MDAGSPSRARGLKAFLDNGLLPTAMRIPYKVAPCALLVVSRFSGFLFLICSTIWYLVPAIPAHQGRPPEKTEGDAGSGACGRGLDPAPGRPRVPPLGVGPGDRKTPRWSAARARGLLVSLLRFRAGEGNEGAAGAPSQGVPVLPRFPLALPTQSAGEETGEHQGAAIRTSALAALHSLRSS